MNELKIITRNGGHYIDSRDVAEVIGKPHNDLMKAIRKYCEYLTAGNFSLSDFYVNSTYQDSTGRILPCYLLTKMGCEMTANKLTGEKGVLFTAAYVQKFNIMESHERTAKNAELADTCMKAQEISARILSAVFDAAYVPEKQRKEVLDLMYQQSGILLPIKSPNVRQAYPVSEITRRLGILSLSGRPHTSAVSAILSMLFIEDEHKIVVDYKNVSFIGYDDYVINSVKDWLKHNDYPYEIPCGAKVFKVRYTHVEDMEDCE